MSTCRACGAECRVTVIALVLEHHRLKGGRVCKSCANGGTLIVAKVHAPVITAPKPSKRTARELLGPVIKTLQAQLDGAKRAPVPVAIAGSELACEDSSRAGRQRWKTFSTC
jgi:hypothetical protein